MRKGTVGGMVIGVVLIAAIVLGYMCMQRVPAGYVGVVYEMSGGVDGEVLTQGWHIVSPTKDVTLYSTGIEQSYLTSENKGDSENDESFNIPTSDGKTVKVNLEFSYRFNPDRVTDTFIQFKGRSGEEVKNSFIKPKIMAWTQEISATYPVTDILGDKRTEINNRLDTYLKEKFEPYGIIIDTVNFTDISVDGETAAAIQKKVTAQQELELANVQSQTAKVQAEKDKQVAIIGAEKEKETASIQAEQAKIKAQGDADAKKIASDAEAEANKKIAGSLTPELIEKIKYEKWNGELPQVQGDTMPIVSVGSK